MLGFNFSIFPFIREEHSEKNCDKKQNRIHKTRENKINSIYVGIKELQSSLNTQDIEIFFINYKNLIERLNVL